MQTEAWKEALQAVMPTTPVTIRRWEIIAAFVLLTASFVLGLWLVVHLNDERAADIQRSRIEACVRSYEGVRQIFRPLIPPPSKQSKGEQERIARFNATIEQLKAGCPQQIKKGATR